ncbi:hypothetical protein DFH06DRAFT_1124883 [Mycena polygramma]|nr:hypothetical protein DFH06DRAFT_1124883 [Mycena polygramma]
MNSSPTIGPSLLFAACPNEKHRCGLVRMQDSATSSSTCSPTSDEAPSTCDTDKITAAVLCLRNAITSETPNEMQYLVAAALDEAKWDEAELTVDCHSRNDTATAGTGAAVLVDEREGGVFLADDAIATGAGAAVLIGGGQDDVLDFRCNSGEGVHFWEDDLI